MADMDDLEGIRLQARALQVGYPGDSAVCVLAEMIEVLTTQVMKLREQAGLA